MDIVGKWTGRLHQRGLPSFAVTATIHAPSSRARNDVQYTGIECGGRWMYLGREGESYHFREVITRGRSSTCKGVGTVTLTPTGSGRLRYEFRGGGIVSRGRLSRVVRSDVRPAVNPDQYGKG